MYFQNPMCTSSSSSNNNNNNLGVSNPDTQIHEKSHGF